MIRLKKAIAIAVLAAGSFLASCAHAADVLVWSMGTAVMHLEDTECSAEVRTLIRKDWKPKLQGGHVAITDPAVAARLGKETIALCWSEMNGGIAFMDEFGFSRLIPKELFHAPGEAPSAPGQDKL